MRKRIISPVQQESTFSVEDDWLDLEKLTEVEITSEEAAYPIELALLAGQASEWRAGESGKQTIRLLFAHPQQLRRIRLNFVETRSERTQEFILSWSSDSGQSFQEIVRQQWNFSRQDASGEIEDYSVDLSAVTVLELTIIPDISGGNAIASLAQLQLA